MVNVEKEDLRVLRTKRILNEAFIQLLKEKPFYKISVHALAEKAQINRVTFYLHYKNMNVFTDNFLSEYLLKIQQSLMNYYDASLPAEERERQMFEHMLQYIQENKEVYQLLFVKKALPQFDQQLIQLLKSPAVEHIHEVILHRQSITDYEMPREVAAWYAISAMIGTITLWLEQDLPYSPKYLADKIVRLNPFRIMT